MLDRRRNTAKRAIYIATIPSPVEISSYMQWPCIHDKADPLRLGGLVVYHSVASIKLSPTSGSSFSLLPTLLPCIYHLLHAVHVVRVSVKLNIIRSLKLLFRYALSSLCFVNFIRGLLFFLGLLESRSLIVN